MIEGDSFALLLLLFEALKGEVQILKLCFDHGVANVVPKELLALL